MLLFQAVSLMTSVSCSDAVHRSGCKGPLMTGSAVWSRQSPMTVLQEKSWGGPSPSLSEE